MKTIFGSFTHNTISFWKNCEKFYRMKEKNDEEKNQGRVWRDFRRYLHPEKNIAESVLSLNLSFHVPRLIYSFYFPSLMVLAIEIVSSMNYLWTVSHLDIPRLCVRVWVDLILIFNSFFWWDHLIFHTAVQPWCFQG